MRCVKSPKQRSGSFSALIMRFRRNQTGAIAPLFALMIPPILLAMMLAIDAANLMRVRGNVQSSLDAAGLAVGKRFTVVSEENQIREFGKKIFEANLRAIEPERTKFTLDFPKGRDSDQQIVVNASFRYISFFGRAAKTVTNDRVDWDKYTFSMSATVRLKNTLEVALVLDNSGSMAERGSGSGLKRIDLLKQASAQLVDKLADQAKLITHLENPVQFSLVPFAASVNIGPENQTQLWMDQTGVSPVHYENFTMPTANNPINVGRNKNIVYRDNVYFKEGSGWGSENGHHFTRFSLYNDMQTTRGRAYTSWKGCVEARPGEYGINADRPKIDDPDTMYVPMFAPDEYDSSRSLNHWWSDNGGRYDSYQTMQRDLKKYYIAQNTSGEGTTGPNYSCTTTPITTLTDVTTDNGLRTVKNAIAKMQPDGGTNVPEGMVWGWRTLIQNSPFTGGRATSERGNDKVVIVLTDGANTYYRYNSLGGTDNANNISNYSSLGYTAVRTTGYDRTRIFQEARGVSNVHDNAYYTEALNARFKRLCELAKQDKIMVMTVALDLRQNLAADRKQMEIMKECASDSRVRFDPAAPTKRAKLFWNTTGSELEQTFREIADELSNLRVVR